MKTCGARHCGSTRRVRVSAWLHDRPWRLTRLTRRVHCERLETASVMHPPHSGTCPRCCHMGRGAVTWGDVGAANRAHTSTGGRADAAHPCPPSRGEDPGYCCPWEALRIPERAPRPSINCWGTIRRSSWLSPWLRRPADAQPRCWAILGRPASLCLLGRWRRQLLAFTLAASAGRLPAGALAKTALGFHLGCIGRPTRSQGVGPYWVGQRVFACWGVGEDELFFEGRKASTYCECKCKGTPSPPGSSAKRHRGWLQGRLARALVLADHCESEWRWHILRGLSGWQHRRRPHSRQQAS
jgi:hypothetical protein